MTFYELELLLTNISALKKEKTFEGIFHLPVWKDNFYRSNDVIVKN